MLNNLDACNERELIGLIIDGNEIAFEKIYRLYSKRLLGNIIKLVKSENLAAELLQDVFVKLWYNRHQIDPAQSPRTFWDAVYNVIPFGGTRSPVRILQKIAMRY